MIYRNLWKVALINLVLCSIKSLAFGLTGSLVAAYGALHDLFDAANTVLAIKLHRRGREKLTVVFNALVLLGGSTAIIVWSIHKLQTAVGFEPVGLVMLAAGAVSITGNTYAFRLTHQGHSRTESILSPHYLEDILDGSVLLAFGATSYFSSIPGWLDPAAAIVIAIIVAVFTVNRLFRDR